MIETLTVWHPLSDRLVSLWLGTVEGDWPCQRWARVVDGRPAPRGSPDYDAAVEVHRRSRRHQHPRSNFSVLRAALEKCPVDSSSLSPLEVGRIRAALNRTVERRGRPGSGPARPGSIPTEGDRHAADPRGDRRRPRGTTRGVPRRRRRTRHRADPRTGGLRRESGHGPRFPATLARKAERALEAPIAELVDRGRARLGRGTRHRRATDQRTGRVRRSRRSRAASALRRDLPGVPPATQPAAPRSRASGAGRGAPVGAGARPVPLGQPVGQCQRPGDARPDGAPGDHLVPAHRAPEPVV